MENSVARLSRLIVSKFKINTINISKKKPKPSCPTSGAPRLLVNSPQLALWQHPFVFSVSAARAVGQAARVILITLSFETIFQVTATNKQNRGTKNTQKRFPLYILRRIRPVFVLLSRPALHFRSPESAWLLFSFSFLCHYLIICAHWNCAPLRRMQDAPCTKATSSPDAGLARYRAGRGKLCDYTTSVLTLGLIHGSKRRNQTVVLEQNVARARLCASRAYSGDPRWSTGCANDLYSLHGVQKMT